MSLADPHMIKGRKEEKKRRKAMCKTSYPIPLNWRKQGREGYVTNLLSWPILGTVWFLCEFSTTKHGAHNFIMPWMIIPLSFLIKKKKISPPDGPQTFAPRNARMIIFSIPFTMVITLWVGIPFCGRLVSLQGVPKA